MLGFHVGFRDYITFIVIFIIGVAFVGSPRVHAGPSGSHRDCAQSTGAALRKISIAAFVAQLALTDQFLK